ncbi:MAG: DNA internalization-related competence protein ComEC/Rec2 [Ignavibacteria bacterium]
MLINKLYNAPAFRFSLLFSIGLIAGRDILFAPLVLIVLIIFCLIFLMKEKNESTKLIIVSIIVVLSGIAKSNYDFHHLEKNSVLNLRSNYSDIYLKGVVTDLPERKGDKVNFKLDSECLISGGDTINISGTFLVTVKQSKEISGGSGIVVPEAGDRVIIFGDMADAPEETNPGEFNYRNYLYLNDIDKIFKVHFFDDINIKDGGNLSFFKQNLIIPARKYAIENINSNIGGNEAAFLNGLVTGYRTDIPREMKEDFVRAGVMHILAVSGLNVAYVIIILSFILGMLRIKLTIKIILYALSLLFYTYFTGATASIIRAVIMGTLMLLVLIVQRKINFYNIIGVSALIILAVDARQLFNPGFILSYASVLSIIFFIDLLNHNFEYFSRKRKGVSLVLNNILLLILSGIAAQLGVLPATTMYFSKISIAGVAANLAAIPLSNFSLALGFFQIIAGVFSSYLCTLVAGVNTLLLKFQLWLIHGLASLKYSYVEISGVTLPEVVVFYIVLFCIVTACRKNLYPRILVSIFVICAALLFAGLTEKNLSVTYLSIGNADCTHIETPDGSNILIDAGIENPYNHSNSTRVVPYLKYKRAGDIDLLVLTSDISKDFRVLKNLTDNFIVHKVIFDNAEGLGSEAENLLAEHKIQYTDIRDVDKVSGFGNVRIYFLKSPSVKSFMVKLIYGNTSFLFPGRSETTSESEFINVYKDLLKSDILKAAKYGSDKSTSQEFLKAVKPNACVITASGTGAQNLPSRNTLERIRNEGIRIIRTDLYDAVTFESDGRSIILKR